MSVAQILALVLMAGVFAGLIGYREWEERRQDQKDRPRRATTSSPQERRQEAAPRQ
jgi:hypothetical protein